MSTHERLAGQQPDPKLEAILETPTEVLQAEDAAPYLVAVVLALVARLGGEVVLTPEELGRASARDAQLEPQGRNYLIKLEPA